MSIDSTNAFAGHEATLTPGRPDDFFGPSPDFRAARPEDLSLEALEVHEARRYVARWKEAREHEREAWARSERGPGSSTVSEEFLEALADQATRARAAAELALIRHVVLTGHGHDAVGCFDRQIPKEPGPCALWLDRNLFVAVPDHDEGWASPRLVVVEGDDIARVGF